MVTNLVDRVCSVVRFERSRNDNNRTLHALNEVFELLACESHCTVLED